jgi:LytS/YehU family sensor histidine kinase
LDKALVSHLILQPLFENAIKHAVARNARRSSMQLSAASKMGIDLRLSNERRESVLDSPTTAKECGWQCRQAAVELLRMRRRPVGRASEGLFTRRAAPAVELTL